MVGRGAIRAEGGQAVVLMALMLTVLLAGGGLAIDAGLLFVERRHEQVAADAAAYAAAVAIATNWTASDRSTRARSAALAYAAANAYNNDGTTNTVTVNVPPLAGAYVGNAAYAEVIVSVDVRTAFVRILGSGFQTRTVQARAVGGVLGPPKPYGLIALSKTACAALSVTGQGEVETEGAGILVNSSCASALDANGQAEIEAEDGGIDVVGGVVATGGTDIDPIPVTGARQVSDPLAYLPRPTGAGLTTFAAVNVTAGPTTIGPGIYPSISVSGNGKVKMQAGTYVIKGGGISASGNGRVEDDANGDGQGVFIFNACADFPATTGACGAISVSGNGRIELEKETSGAYAGVSIWQPCENTQTLSVTGGGADASGSAGSGDGDDDEDGELETSGTIYIPCAAVSVTGHGELEIEDGQLVASTISVVGNAELEIEWDSAVSSVSRIPALVE